MSWEDLHEVVKNWSDLRVERPFIQKQAPFLVDAAEEGLTRQYPDLELATLAILELEHRESPKAFTSASKIRLALREKGHQPIPWLMQARSNLKFLKFEHKAKKSYKTSLYVILRDGFSDNKGRYGIYVGETTKAVEERFQQHISGIKAGKGLPKHGIQLLHSLMWPWQKVPWEDSMNLFYESALHKALTLDNSSGPKVSGNTQEIIDWPDGFQIRLISKITC
tara:strand:- start:480 stop:1148 length:669 start_codon:yes stop_codon:yes gene_type:complete